MSAVTVRRESLVLSTYLPAAPDRHPMFFEKRIYQGSAGKVYPLPYHDRISEVAEEREWDAVFLENEYLEVMILPQLGGRIHRMIDKVNGYDAIYHQPVIKPALVGLAGPWVSGGIEFNWPQHHRPSTFMPADVRIERDRDGSVTVWLGEHDPMQRMKGMHGVCLHPGRAVMELKGRVYNRTDDVQTFLWWVNTATRVHEAYQSFFPADAVCVTDHAKRAMSAFPACSGSYYGVDYGARGRDGVPLDEMPSRYVPAAACPANDLSWYANLPVPTSYMCMGSKGDFFGGYDFREKAGIVHVASHHISPGKKQWTWGNHEFGYAWDRNLTEPDENGEYRPYIELMAGVYTDNQPDFSYLQPGETKSWSQYWYPIRKIGPPCAATADLVLSLSEDGTMGIQSTRKLESVRVKVHGGGKVLHSFRVDLLPEKPIFRRIQRTCAEMVIVIKDGDGRELLKHSVAEPVVPSEQDLAAMAAKEPPLPEKMGGADELYLTGVHLEQYRQATRCPTMYWREALRRDPGDSRSHLAMGRWHLRRGEFAVAEKHLRCSIARMTLRNPNPGEGEAYYQLGRCLRFQGQTDEAYECYYKATWNQAWAGASFHRLAEIDCLRGDYEQASLHLQRSIRLDADCLKARDLLAMVMRKLGRRVDLKVMETLVMDPLDAWALWLAGKPGVGGASVSMDLALDFVQAGFYKDALEMLDEVESEPFSGVEPMVHYYRGWIRELAGGSGRLDYLAGAAADADYCFPARLIEQSVLEAAIRFDPADANARAALGYWLYDRKRHHEAIVQWEAAVAADPGRAVVWRCLGIAYFNILRKPAMVRAAYQNAVKCAPDDARLIYEQDQVAKKMAVSPRTRLKRLSAVGDLRWTRDDLALEICALYNQTGRSGEALEILRKRKFQPWEGGEGGPLGQYVRACLLLGRASQDMEAVEFYQAALCPPTSLGESRHLLANPSDVHLMLGDALRDAGDLAGARIYWTLAARARGDFQNMSVCEFSEMTYYSAVAMARLGDDEGSERLLGMLMDHAKVMAKSAAPSDYFVTSRSGLPLFDEDLEPSRKRTAKFLEAQARFGMGQGKKAVKLLTSLLEEDPNDGRAADFLTYVQALGL